MTLLLREGVSPRYLEPGTPEPKKHQLLLEFNNKGRLSCSVTMYGSFQIIDANAQNDEYFVAARINPKTEVGSLDANDLAALLTSLKSTLKHMVACGGRNVERDLFGNPGGYRCILSAKTWKEPCPRCHGSLVKGAFLGGSIYYCPACQLLA